MFKIKFFLLVFWFLSLSTSFSFIPKSAMLAPQSVVKRGTWENEIKKVFREYREANRLLLKYQELATEPNWGDGDPKGRNEIFKKAVQQREQPRLTFDVLTQRGKDPDQGEFSQIGVGGVSLFSFGDFKNLFEGLDVTQVLTQFTQKGLTAVWILAGYVALIREHDQNWLKKIEKGENVENGKLVPSKEFLKMFSEKVSFEIIDLYSGGILSRAAEEKTPIGFPSTDVPGFKKLPPLIQNRVKNIEKKAMSPQMDEFYLAQKRLAQLMGRLMKRNNVRVSYMLERLKKAAKDRTEDLFDVTVESIQAGVTLGEWTDVLRPFDKEQKIFEKIFNGFPLSTIRLIEEAV